jgi:hypothetical protein
MSFEYGLLPKPETKVFTTDQLVAMGNYVASLPSYKWNEKTYTLFRDEENKRVALPSLITLKGLIYTYPYIALGEEYVTLSIVGDPEGADRHLYTFVLWCQEQFPCDLFYWDKIVAPEEMLAQPE